MLGEIKLKKKILWRNTLNEIQSNLFNTFSNIIPSKLFKMNIFGLLGIFLLLSGIGSGYLAYVGIMEIMK